MVAILGAYFRDVVPPSLEISEISTSCGIISKPHLCNFSVFEAMNEWCDGYRVHCHGKWISLDGAFWERRTSPSMKSETSSL